MKKSLLPIILVSIFALCSCSYRFTNTHLTPPAHIKKIAVEGVYDISREVISHELLWAEIQTEIAKSGKVKLSSQRGADALMRIKIENANIVPSSITDSKSSGQVYPSFNDNLPKTLEQLKESDIANIAESRSKGGKEFFSITCNIEVWNLHSRKLLFKKSYSQTRDLKIDVNTITPNDLKNESLYLRYEEQIDVTFKDMAKTIGREAIRDFLLN